MTDARRKTRIALLEAGQTFRDLEQGTGLKRGTIHNLLSDPSGSAKAKQTITNFLGVEIWPEIAATKRRVLFTRDIEIKFTTPDTAFQFAQRFPAGYVKGNSSHRLQRAGLRSPRRARIGVPRVDERYICRRLLLPPHPWKVPLR